MDEGAPLIFISYASPDRERVDPIVDRLEHSGLNVWMDHRCIRAGQNWNLEIRRALGKAAIVVVFMSELSVDRRGYAQREIKIALEQAEEKLTSDIYIIPVLIDSLSEFPESVRHLHMVKAWESGSIEKIIESISQQISQLGQHAQHVQSDSRIRWVSNTFKESWDGLPGYEIEYNIFSMSSSDIPKVGDITDMVRGRISELASGNRRSKFSQNSVDYNFGQSRYRRTNVFSAHCREPVVVNHVICVPYFMHTYNAGAAHGMEWIESFNFTLEPITRISEIQEIFVELEAAFSVIQRAVRSQLAIDLISDEYGNRDLYNEWINNGTEDWSHFRNFSFSGEGIEFHFPPYQVASYADGIRTVIVSNKLIYKLMSVYLVDALGWTHLRWQEEAAL